ncbi:MAG TPA: hypothetical protein VMN37_10725 [Gemmatimonadales bacterium]|nr:hypothetical protein [Gemmatimonadales bacterium]
MPSSAVSTIAASRWQTVPVVIWRTGAPLRASRAARPAVSQRMAISSLGVPAC